MAKMPQPPPIPPRSPSVASSVSSLSSNDDLAGQRRARTDTVHLTPYTAYSSSDKRNNPYGGATGLDDPRTSSTQSLRPVESPGSNRRKLLLIYIHGFMGTETSFRSFPAHVHNLLSISLADSHVVHTKIYPRYQSRKNISYARDAFSNWLTPHESENTDVILIGHSLGGILAAEVVLLPSHRPQSKHLFQHRILGHIAYDTPFLGMHPGVVSTGIASLFRSTPDPPEAPAYEQSTSASLSFNPFERDPTDPNYNPAYTNDVNLPVRKGKLDQAFYFLNKHYGEWRKAATSYVKSHLEFGGCLADFDGLKKRYRAFRPLEDVDDLADHKTASGKHIPRVRFVNYYTASTGRIKPRPPQDDNQKVLVAETEMVEQRPSLDIPRCNESSHPSTPRFSLSEHRGDEVVRKDLDDLNLGINDEGEAEMQHLEPQAEPPSPHLGEAIKNEQQPLPEINTTVSTDLGESSLTSPQDSASVASSQAAYSALPSLPDPPVAPPAFDPSPYRNDAAMLKLAQKEHDRTMRSYERAEKDYNRTIREREKHLAKLENAMKKQEMKESKELSAHEKHEQERLKKEEERMQKERERLERGMQKEEIKRSATLNQEQYDAAMARQRAREDAAQVTGSQSEASRLKTPKKQRDRKFCTLPKKDPKTGMRDPTWIRVYLEDMDEVVAHTSLFVVSETYAKLVGDTAERIEQWVRDDATVKAVRHAQAWEQGGI